MKNLLASVALAFAVLVPGAAMAEEGHAGKPAVHFPMPAAEFQSHVAAKLTRARSRMEAKIAERKVEAAKAAEMRAKRTEVEAKVAEAVKAAVADGTVTEDEAKAVKRVARPHGGGHRHGAHAAAHPRAGSERAKR